MLVRATPGQTNGSDGGHSSVRDALRIVNEQLRLRNFHTATMPGENEIAAADPASFVR